MITEGIGPPKKMVEPKRHPGKRLIVAELKRSEYTANFRPAKSAVTEILHDGFNIRVDEPVSQHREKFPEGDQYKQRREKTLIQLNYGVA